MRRSIVLVAVGALVLASTPVPAADSSPETWTVDANHGLANAEAVAEYQESGEVTHEFQRVAMGVTITADADSVGVGGLRSDSIRHYISFKYSESITREVRLYVPSGYWHPHRKSGVEALEDESVTAELRPVENDSYTAVTVTLSEPGRYTFPVHKAHSSVIKAKDTGREIIENATGVGLPSLTGGGGNWEYIDSADLAGNTTPSVPGDATIHYNAGTVNDSRWLTVPDCDGSAQPVCVYERAGTDEKFVRAGVTDPPRVRYRTGGGGWSVSTAVSDAWSAVEEALEDAKELLGMGGDETDQTSNETTTTTPTAALGLLAVHRRRSA